MEEWVIEFLKIIWELKEEVFMVSVLVWMLYNDEEW
jgi:hypothetical protein